MDWLSDFMEIPAGEFEMGGSRGDKFVNATELPRHRVTIPFTFRMAKYPVTESQWREFSGEGSASDLPVVKVSWRDAVAYCAWLGERLARVCRLPSEEEWEYACRAGSATPFEAGNALGAECANYLYDESGDRVGPGQRTPVGQFPPNPFGLFDMQGNVCEWVADAWRSGYDAEPIEGLRTIRGGAWDYLPRLLRASWRDFASESVRRDNLGFRVVLETL